MLEELKQIETNTLDDLAKLQKERTVLDERLAKLDERKDSVSPEVWSKVAGDYQTRIDELDQAASPLKLESRRQYATLGHFYEKIEAALKKAELEKEEIELRHELGEFTKKEYQNRVEESESIVLAHRQEIEAADTLKQRFIDVFGSEEELALSEEMDIPLTSTEEEEIEEEEGIVEEGADGDSLEEPEEEVAATEIEAASADDSDSASDAPDDLDDDADEAWDDDDPTMDAPSPLLKVDEEPEERTSNLETLDDAPSDETVEDANFAPPPPPSGTDDGEGSTPEGVDATVILSRPRLVAMENGMAVEEFILSVDTTSLGRAPENSVCLNHDSISRQHAAIVPTPEGFMICDLHSENGTYVNDEKIHERHLTDGDVVRLGATIFIYRS